MDENFKALVRAQARAFAMLCAYLERDGLIPRGELGRSLGLLAVITAETDPDAGDIMAARRGHARKRPPPSVLPADETKRGRVNPAPRGHAALGRTLCAGQCSSTRASVGPLTGTNTRGW